MNLLAMVLLGANLQAPVKMNAQQDHAFLLKQLGISSLRGGKDGMNPQSPNFANTDESKANPYNSIPALMTFNNGRPVKNRGDWGRRSKEIRKMLDDEIYGVTPKRLPKVNWVATSAPGRQNRKA